MILHDSNEKILPNLEAIKLDIKRLGLDVNVQFQEWQETARSTSRQNQHPQLLRIANKRKIVRSSGSIISSLDTIREKNVGHPVTYDEV